LQCRQKLDTQKKVKALEFVRVKKCKEVTRKSERRKEREAPEQGVRDAMRE